MLHLYGQELRRVELRYANSYYTDKWLAYVKEVNTLQDKLKSIH
jgi:hypothetical protein